jgi:4-carboxymuconolactone decarboxylase
MSTNPSTTGARIDPPGRPGPLTRFTWWIARRKTDGRLPEPLALMAHSPLIMQGYGGFELAFERAKRAPRKLLALAELKASALAGCEWCMDFGSLVAQEQGVSEEQLRALPAFRDSDAFSDEEKLVLEYTEGISRTPVEISDELFARMRERFDEGQIVEITWAAAIENLRARFNWALGIGSQGYSEGAFCIRPETVGSTTEKTAEAVRRPA